MISKQLIPKKKLLKLLSARWIPFCILESPSRQCGWQGGYKRALLLQFINTTYSLEEDKFK